MADYLNFKSRPMYYKRDGTPYEEIYDPEFDMVIGDALAWAKDFENSNRFVAKSKLWWGGYVSTVWLGLDHSFFSGPPLIFETMVFSFFGRSLDINRYSTENEAWAGHWEMVNKWKFNRAIIQETPRHALQFTKDFIDHTRRKAITNFEKFKRKTTRLYWRCRKNLRSITTHKNR